MNPVSDKPSFLDRGTIIALVVTLLFWIGWTRYMESKHPKSTPDNVATTQIDGTTQEPGQDQASAPSASDNAVAAKQVNQAEESWIEYEDQLWRFQVSSKGLGLKNILLKNYQNRSGEPVVLGVGASSSPFTTYWIATGEPIDFAIERINDVTFVGKAEIGALQIEKTMRVNSLNYSVDTEVKISGFDSGFQGVATILGDTLQGAASGGFFTGGSYDHQEWFIVHEGTTTREILDKAEGLPNFVRNNINIAALSEHYFAMAVVDQSDLAPSFVSNIAPNSSSVTGSLRYQPVSQRDSMVIKYKGYAGPKKFDILESVDEELTRVIDFGIFAFLAKPMLSLMKWLHGIFGNWGWAIVALTIIVRLIVLPFNVYSYKSMKAMQKIQPEMARIREKYKDKPADQRLMMNQEIMALMKRHNANPIGGCLPMLLQLPVFFALFQVLGQSIELYRAPFVFWINDLSLKDPFYVLPILMAVTMFVQQKITPTTMDPQQAKIMLWMPVIFALFMVSLPSGLTLYIFVSTLFGIIQQYVFMRDKSLAKTVKEAKA